MLLGINLSMPTLTNLSNFLIPEFERWSFASCQTKPNDNNINIEGRHTCAKYLFSCLLWYFKEFATHAHPVARDGPLYFPLSSRGLEYASAQGLCAIYCWRCWLLHFPFLPCFSSIFLYHLHAKKETVFFVLSSHIRLCSPTSGWRWSDCVLTSTPLYRKSLFGKSTLSVIVNSCLVYVTKLKARGECKILLRAFVCVW